MLHTGVMCMLGWLSCLFCILGRRAAVFSRVCSLFSLPPRRPAAEKRQLLLAFISSLLPAQIETQHELQLSVCSFTSRFDWGGGQLSSGCRKRERRAAELRWICVNVNQPEVRLQAPYLRRQRCSSHPSRSQRATLEANLDLLWRKGWRFTKEERTG